MMSKHKKDHEKKPWLMLCLLSLLFYGAMLLLTVFADDIHNARLPKVTAAQPEKQKFSYTLTTEDGETITKTRSCNALPKEMVDSGKVFTLKTVTENGKTFYYAEPLKFIVDTTLSHPDYYAISTGSIFGSTIILTGYEALSAGMEVFLIKDEIKTNELSTENLFQ